jgi:ribosomal protein L40E
MFCIECGTELPDEAKFCFKCGKPTAGGESKQKAEQETCEIVYEITGEKHGIYPRTLLRFKAQAKGAEGEYCAGISNEFEANLFDYPGSPEKKSKKHKAALDSLSEKLKQAGWQAEDHKGPEWFSLRFRREETE